MPIIMASTGVFLNTDEVKYCIAPLARLAFVECYARAEEVAHKRGLPRLQDGYYTVGMGKHGGTEILIQGGRP